MENIFLTVFNMSITACYVIIAVLLIRLFMKKAPKKYSYLLWSVVGFRLICPISFRSAFSIFGLKLFDLSQAQKAETAAIQYIPQNVGMMAAPEMTSGLSNVNGAVSRIPLPAPESPVQSANPMQIILALCVLLWCAGIAVLLLYGVISYARVRYRMRTAVQLEGNVYQSDRVRSPFILGFFCPRIYIPFGLDEQTQRYVLMHERYHLKRKDHIIKLTAFLLLTLHWFNPLCWISFVLMGKDMEMSCDEKVLSEGQNIRKLYGTALLSFAANRRFPAPGPLAFGETGVKARIKNVLGWKKPKPAVTAVAAVVCCAVLAACAANPETGETSESLATVETANTEAELESPFGHSYQVEEIFYQAPWYDFAYTLETAPKYRLTEECRLAVIYESPTGADGDESRKEELFPDVMEEISLTQSNFDDCFINTSEGGFAFDADSVEVLRKENQKTWRIILPGAPNDGFYSVMQQKNGDLYLVYGYYVPEENESEQTAVRWVFKLTECDMEVSTESLEAPQEEKTVGSITVWNMSNSESVSTDADGDGETEQVLLIPENPASSNGNHFEGGYTLRVGNRELKEYADNPEQTILAFSPDGQQVLLGIYDEGPSADPTTRFYRYDSSGLHAAGTIPEDIRRLQIDQNGIITCPYRVDIIQTSFVWSYWYWDGNEIVMRQDAEYEFIQPENAEIPITLLESLQIYPQCDETAEADTMLPQNVKLIKTDLKEWVFIRAEDGTEGWLRVDLYTIPSLGNKESREVFDGLNFFG